MKVLLYGPDYNRKHEVGWLTTYALSEGLTKLGVEHSVRWTGDWEKDGKEIADICIVNGWWKKFIDGRPRTNRNVIIKAQEAAGKPAWCIERGFLLDREKWSGFSINGFCSNGGDFRAQGMPPDRWIRVGIELQPWRKPTADGYVLLCAQVPWDTQVQDGNHLAWLEETVREIKKHTDRPIVFRGHPKAWRRTNPYSVISKETWALMEYRGTQAKPPSTTFEEDLEGAHCVVCYNSNVAVLCVVAGVPVFTGAACLADPIAVRCKRDCCTMFDMIDDPPVPTEEARRQWACDIAYKQWEMEEWRQGLPWLHLSR